MPAGRIAERIVSLLPSATEIVCALGLGDRLVGRSHECDHLPAITKLPVCTEPRFSVEGSSREIDERVKALVRDGLSVYRVDAEALRALRPDAIVTQDQCKVCAVSLDVVEGALAEWLGARPRLVSLQPQRLADVWTDVERAGTELGVAARGHEVAEQLRRRIQDIAARASACAERPRVACLEWIDPLMAAGHWMPELVELAGGVPLLGHAGEPAPWTSLEAVREADPDLIVVLPCGFDLKRTRRELSALAPAPEWNALRAVRSRNVLLADGNQYFNRPGPRLVESLEILAEMLHPVLRFGHEGVGWARA